MEMIGNPVQIVSFLGQNYKPLLFHVYQVPLDKKPFKENTHINCDFANKKHLLNNYTLITFIVTKAMSRNTYCLNKEKFFYRNT